MQPSQVGCSQAELGAWSIPVAPGRAPVPDPDRCWCPKGCSSP